MSIVRLSKVAATFACGLLALCLALQLWQAYVLAPWTRDGRVSAQVIRIAPEVSGSVEAVFVADNQRVARGDPLYRIDPRSYRLAVRQREAELEQARETLRQRDEQWRRRMQLAGAVSREEVRLAAAGEWRLAAILTDLAWLLRAYSQSVSSDGAQHGEKTS
ncbi:hypothetical protein M770_10485 [Pseudomonas aeruginosa VRFPA03]|nr:hypothetical protein M770_10485 [Pseudomonas aeruginosa VRFPA03]